MRNGSGTSSQLWHIDAFTASARSFGVMRSMSAALMNLRSSMAATYRTSLLVQPTARDAKRSNNPNADAQDFVGDRLQAVQRARGGRCGLFYLMVG